MAAVDQSASFLGMASISQTTEALKDFGAKITDTLGGRISFLFV